MATNYSESPHLEEVNVCWMHPSFYSEHSPKRRSLLEKINGGFWYTPHYGLVEDPMSWHTFEKEIKWLKEMEVYKKQAEELFKELETYEFLKEFPEEKKLLLSFLYYYDARENYYINRLCKDYMDVDWSFKLPELMKCPARTESLLPELRKNYNDQEMDSLLDEVMVKINELCNEAKEDEESVATRSSIWDPAKFWKKFTWEIDSGLFR